MFRFAVPVILIGASVAGFMMFTNPLYKEVVSLRTEVADYNKALDNSKALESERDKLTQKYNSISQGDLDKLKKLLPDSVDNIKLILEIEKLASPYGMVLKDVKYEVVSKNDPNANTGTTAGGNVANAKNVGGNATLKKEDNKNYGTWDLEFSVQGNYYNFLNFVRNLESNLRIVDVSSVDFSSDTGAEVGLNTVQPSNNYKYQFKIKTYWLKN
jgi:hypothetical protein